MRRMARNAIRAVLAISVASCLSIVALPSAATAATVQPANASRGYVDGTAAENDDWGDEATLCDGCAHSDSNYALMWQAVLYADLADFPADELDCDFGPTTAAYTRQWQAEMGLPQTGQLDPDTLRTAQQWLVADGSSSDGEYVRYVGGVANRYIEFQRHGAGYSSPYLYDMNLLGQWHGVWYGSANFCG